MGVQGRSTGLFATDIYGVVKTPNPLVASGYVVDRTGRRTLLLGGAAIMTFSNFFVGAYIKIGKPSEDDVQISGGVIAACAFIYVYVIGFVSSFAGVPFILASETVSLSVRAISATLGAATQ
jgi:MFS family permease